MNKKGQMTIVGLIVVFLMLVAYGAMLPSINDAIDTILPQVGEGTQLVISLIPLALALVIFMSIFVYSQPGYA